MDTDTGIFTAPMGGTYLFVFHIATHDNKKALLSIRLNGEEVASVFDQVTLLKHQHSSLVGEDHGFKSLWGRKKFPLLFLSRNLMMAVNLSTSS